MPFYRGHPFHIDWWNVAGHVAYLNVFTGAKWLQDVYWTLAIEFQYYILIAVVYGLLISKNIYLRLLFFILFMASFWLRPFLPSSTYIFSFAPYFILGILLFQYYCSIISSIESWLLLLLTVGVLYSYDGPVLTSIAVITIVLIAFVKKVHPVFIFLGAISYSLYLVHIPMGGRFISIAVRLLPASVHTKEALVFAALGFCLLTAWVYYTLIEKRFKLLASKIGYTEKIVPAPVLNNADLISKT